MAMAFVWTVVTLALMPAVSFCQDTLDPDCKIYQPQVLECKNLGRYPSWIPPTVNTVTFSDCEFPKLEVLPDAYKNVSELFIRSSRANTIADEAFAKLPILRVLLISGNTFEDRLTPEMFDGLGELTEILLNNNVITSFPDDILTGMDKLQRVSLNGNPGIRLAENSLVNKEDSGITRVCLNHCGLRAVPLEALSKLPNLSALELDWNNFGSLTSEIFGSLPELTQIQLDSANISSIHENAFEGLPKVKQLYLGNNQLKSIPSRAFLPFYESLTTLCVEHNHLETLSEGLLPWAAMEVVRLAHNPWVCDCGIRWITKLPPSSIHSGENVSCAAPEEFKYQDAYNATMSLDCYQTSYIGVYVAIPLIIILTGVIIFIIVKICQTRSKERSKGVRYSAVYKDTVYKGKPMA